MSLESFNDGSSEACFPKIEAIKFQKANGLEETGISNSVGVDLSSLKQAVTETTPPHSRIERASSGRTLTENGKTIVSGGDIRPVDDPRGSFDDLIEAEGLAEKAKEFGRGRPSSWHDSMIKSYGIDRFKKGHPMRELLMMFGQIGSAAFNTVGAKKFLETYKSMRRYALEIS